MSISERQGKRLGLKACSRWSPYLEKCCLLVSANESYERSAEDIATLTGVKVSRNTQQRLVHRQGVEPLEVDCGIKEMSIDGGKVRLRTSKGKPSEWRDYKGVESTSVLCQRLLSRQSGLSQLGEPAAIGLSSSLLGRWA